MTAAVSGTRVESGGRSQFQGLFSVVWTVEATIDFASTSGNSTDVATVSVPGIDPLTDILLGYSRATSYADGADFDIAHIATDSIHVIYHNDSGSPVNPASSLYHFVVGRRV